MKSWPRALSAGAEAGIVAVAARPGFTVTLVQPHSSAGWLSSEWGWGFPHIGVQMES